MAVPPQTATELATAVRTTPLVAPRPGQVPVSSPLMRRVCFAAARFVLIEDAPERAGEGAPGGAAVDWDASWALRRRLHDVGFPLAEGLDLAERERVGWEALKRSLAERAARGLPAGFLFGAGAEQLSLAPSIPELVAGVVEQVQAIEEAGGVPVILPLVPLARRRASEREHVEVFRALLDRVGGPVLLEGVGSGGSPALHGAFPGRSFERVLELGPDKVRGARVARFAPDDLARLRSTLPERGQALLVGDDPRFARTLVGSEPAPRRSTELAGRTIALGAFAHGASRLVEALCGPLGRLLTRIERNEDHDPLELAALDGFAEALVTHERGLDDALELVTWLDGRRASPPATFDAAERRALLDLARAAGALQDSERAAERVASLRTW